MISKPTVLILGAGASMHAGYPSGTELVKRICNLAAGFAPPNALVNVNFPDFFHRLQFSSNRSIDSFLGTYPRFEEAGKYLIACELKQQELVGHLFSHDRPGWYYTLLESLLVNGKPEFDKNPITIVTFNYDRSLEAFLYTALQNRFDMSPEQAGLTLKQIPIIHVHGILGDFPAIEYAREADTSKIMRISKGLKIIHEMLDVEGQFANPEFERAHQSLTRAERIFFLGFGFHPDNIRRFQFFKPGSIQKATIKSTNVGIRGVRFGQLQAELQSIGIGTDSLPREDDIDCNAFFERVYGLT